MERNISKNSSGQAMILATVMLGGMMLAATAIAGLLMFFQLKQSNDAISSASAVFAADAGLEAGLDCYFHDPNIPPNPTGSFCERKSTDFSQPFLNGATYSSSLVLSSTGFTETSQGSAGQAERVLQNNFSTQ